MKVVRRMRDVVVAWMALGTVPLGGITTGSMAIGSMATGSLAIGSLAIGSLVWGAPSVAKADDSAEEPRHVAVLASTALLVEPRSGAERVRLDAGPEGQTRAFILRRVRERDGFVEVTTSLAPQTAHCGEVSDRDIELTLFARESDFLPVLAAEAELSLDDTARVRVARGTPVVRVGRTTRLAGPDLEVDVRALETPLETSTSYGQATFLQRRQAAAADPVLFAGAKARFGQNVVRTRNAGLGVQPASEGAEMLSDACVSVVATPLASRMSRGRPDVSRRGLVLAAFVGDAPVRARGAPRETVHIAGAGAEVSTRRGARVGVVRFDREFPAGDRVRAVGDRTCLRFRPTAWSVFAEAPPPPPIPGEISPVLCVPTSAVRTETR